MYNPITSLITLLALSSSAVLAAPLTLNSRATACFVIGSVAIPAEVQTAVNSVQPVITCNNAKTTLSGVPDVTSGGTSFSSINFATSKLTPLAFALSKFATPGAGSVATADLALFKNELNTYLATEAGIRSVGGGLSIKAPKFFLSFQIARILTAQGTAITDPGQTVQHLLGKVIKNAGSAESQATKDAITALASVLA